MSTITLDANTFSALLTPIGRTLPRKTDTGLIEFANAVMALQSIADSTVVDPTIAESAVRTVAPVQTTPRSKSTTKRDDTRKVWELSVNERTARYQSNPDYWTSAASSAQIRRIVAIQEEHFAAEPFTATELKSMSSYDSAEWYVYMVQTVKGIDYVTAPVA